MPTHSDRPAIRRRIRDILQAAVTASEDGDPLFGWQVNYRFPGDELGDKSVTLGAVTGTKSDRTFGGERRGTDDDFTIQCIVWLFGAEDDESGDTEVQATVDAIEDALLPEPRLGAPDLGAVLSIGDQDGPDVVIPEGQEEQLHQAVLSLDVRCRVRGA